MLIDLHFHSTASDGTSSPEELVYECLEKGIERAALTDHDNIDGQAAFLAEANKAGLSVVSGIEFNVAYEGEMHILAYNIDINYPPLNDALNGLKKRRRDRAFEMIDNLRKNGYMITIDEVKSFSGDEYIGRPHIARALYAAGYAKDTEEGFNKFLNPGCPGWAPRYKIDKRDAVRLALEAGGVCVLAHPALTRHKDFPKLFKELKDIGVSGIEAFYPLHSDEETKYFLTLAQSLGLFVTQGSDYHGAIRKARRLGEEQRGENFVKEGTDIIFEKRYVPKG